MLAYQMHLGLFVRIGLPAKERHVLAFNSHSLEESNNSIPNLSACLPISGFVCAITCQGGHAARVQFIPLCATYQSL